MSMLEKCVVLGRRYRLVSRAAAVYSGDARNSYISSTGRHDGVRCRTQLSTRYGATVGTLLSRTTCWPGSKSCSSQTDAIAICETIAVIGSSRGRVWLNSEVDVPRSRFLFPRSEPRLFPSYQLPLYHSAKLPTSLSFSLCFYHLPPRTPTIHTSEETPSVRVLHRYE